MTINLSTASVRERLKEVLRQYELRERHFECVIRSKELEVLLSRARAAEQKQLASGEKTRADKHEDEVRSFSVIIVRFLHLRYIALDPTTPKRPGRFPEWTGYAHRQAHPVL